jgi:hypothetical protein
MRAYVPVGTRVIASGAVVTLMRASYHAICVDVSAQQHEIVQGRGPGTLGDSTCTYRALEHLEVVQMSAQQNLTVAAHLRRALWNQGVSWQGMLFAVQWVKSAKRMPLLKHGSDSGLRLKCRPVSTQRPPHPNRSTKKQQDCTRCRSTVVGQNRSYRSPSGRSASAQDSVCKDTVSGICAVDTCKQRRGKLWPTVAQHVSQRLWHIM